MCPAHNPASMYTRRTMTQPSAIFATLSQCCAAVLLQCSSHCRGGLSCCSVMQPAYSHATTIDRPTPWLRNDRALRYSPIGRRRHDAQRCVEDHARQRRMITNDRTMTAKAKNIRAIVATTFMSTVATILANSDQRTLLSRRLHLETRCWSDSEW